MEISTQTRKKAKLFVKLGKMLTHPGADYSLYTQQQKKRQNLLLLNGLKIKYVELKKYLLRVKLIV